MQAFKMVKKIFYRKNIIKNAQTDKVDYKNN